MADKKISLAETVLVMMFVIFIDLLELVLGLLAVGLIINSFIDLVVGAGIQLWIRLKGIKGASALAGTLIEFIPVVNLLPIRSVTMAITIFIANRPAAANIAGLMRGKSAVRSPAGQKIFAPDMGGAPLVSQAPDAINF